MNCFELTCNIQMSSEYFITIIILSILANLNIGLNIADIVVASKWVDCHLDYVNIYLYCCGSTGLVFWIGKILLFKQVPFFYILTDLSGIAHIVFVIWGTTIFYNSDSGDCIPRYYLYAYYHTLVVIFLIVACLACIWIYFERHTLYDLWQSLVQFVCDFCQCVRTLLYSCFQCIGYYLCCCRQNVNVDVNVDVKVDKTDYVKDTVEIEIV